MHDPERAGPPQTYKYCENRVVVTAVGFGQNAGVLRFLNILVCRFHQKFASNVNKVLVADTQWSIPLPGPLQSKPLAPFSRDHYRDLHTN